MKSKIEILAPAGSMEALVAAINGGCDAVYVGGDMFGARAYATNFGQEELLEAIQYVHLYGKQLFLTVNTLLKNKELEEKLYNYLKKPYEMGLDAVIVQDVGVLRFIHNHFPDLAIHASTQMSLTMAQGAKLLEGYGITRLVTSRELSLEEIRELRDNTELEIESFVHGALCYSYSGQCLMSSMLGGRSGNRGRCAGTCRMPYELKKDGSMLSEKNKPYLLSPKDICTLDIIPEMIEAGIDSFKIEGRMKRPEYTALVASIYRKYVDLYEKLGKSEYNRYLDKNKKEFQEDRAKMMELYNRGNSSNGYYTCHNGKHMMSMERPNHNGIYVGEVQAVKGNVATIYLKEAIFAQDILEIRGSKGENYEYTVKEDSEAKKIVTARFHYGLRFQKGDCVYRTKQQKLIHEIQELYVNKNRRISMCGRFEAKIGEQMSLSIQVREHRIQVNGPIVEMAQKQAITEEKVRTQLKKINNTLFEWENLSIEIQDNVFVPVGWINDLRRNAIEALEEKIIQSYKRKLTVEHYNGDENKKSRVSEKNQKLGFSVLVSKEEQLNVALEFPEVNNIYYRMDDITIEEGLALAKKVRKNEKRFFLVLPHVFRMETYEEFSKEFKQYKESIVQWVDGFVIKNLEELEFLKSSQLEQLNFILDYNVYSMNKEAKEFWKEQGIMHDTASVELNFQELKNLGCDESDIVVYGHIPLMISAQCLVKNTVGCNKKVGEYELTDRYQKSFIVKNYCKYCYNCIYNSEPINLLEHCKEIVSLRPKNIRLEFTIEKGNSARKILQAFINTFVYTKEAEFTPSQITKGHFKRGVE